MTMALISGALAPTVVIRAARGSDGPMLRRLAALDSAAVPAGEVLIAESEGAVVAAHSPATGATIADPFRRTAEVVELLELRGAMLRAA
jgi:2-keto-4-pentenoate hydratase